MKEDNFFWKYKYEPGKKLKNKNEDNVVTKPLVSIITSYYNSNEFMGQTINCVLNQTFQSWEWIIVDDGSTEKDAIDYLNEVKKIDYRIKIYHKENEGLALGRDYAIKYSTANYILPLDADDLIEETYIETLYWTLETNKDASWAFTDSVGFGKYRYLSNEEFDSEKMKVDNQITATALLRKEEVLKLGGYRKAKRYVNEDWHLWLRMLADNQFPVQVGYYGFWYRRREESLLTDINDEKKKEYELKRRELKLEADKIKNRIQAIRYPKRKIKNILQEKKLKGLENIRVFTDQKENILYILPYLGTDKKMYRKIKKDAKEKNIYIITMEKSKYSQYMYRQKYEEFSTVYDLTTFLDSEYWIEFIIYLITTRKIKNVFLSNTIYNTQLEEKFDVVKIQNCQNSYIVYNFNILKYKIINSFIIRAFRKIGRYFLKTIKGVKERSN